MKVSKELEKTMANDATNIKSVNVVYNNGSTLSGFLRSARFIPLQVILCKHSIKKGEDEYASLDFENAVEITIAYIDGSSEIFE